MLRPPYFLHHPVPLNLLTCLRAQAGLIDGVSAAADQNAAGLRRKTRRTRAIR